MQIVVKGNVIQKEEFLSKGIPDGISITWLEDGETIPVADAYFDLLFEDRGAAFEDISGKPVFANAVIETGAHLPANYTRINGWNGFLKRPVIEISAAGSQISTDAGNILDSLGWKYKQVADEPGMIAARVIAMIINEAYFGLDDGISTRTEIDTAMKLGTNYPYGPFEWSEKIGLLKIYALLKKLSERDSRYAPAPGLETAVSHI
jgi:3-hydroxybutyryl-CoA dehydrogenase